MATKLTILNCTNHTSIPLGNTEYFMFDARTEKNEDVQVMLSENMLLRAGISDSYLYDELAGSSVMLGDQRDRYDRDVIEATAEERIQRVLDGEIYERTGQPYSFVLCNSATDRIVVGDLFRVARKELTATVNAKAKIEADEKRRQEKLRLAMERLAQRTAKVAPKTNDAKVEEPVKNPVAETVADEDPF
jgi:hypothetical protein